MAIDFVAALKAPFKTERWYLRYFGYFFLLMIPIVNLIPTGFFVSYLSNLLNGDETVPKLSGSDFSLGCKYCIGSLLVLLPVILIYVIVLSLGDFRIVMISSFLLYFLLFVIIGFIFPLLFISFARFKRITDFIEFSRAFTLLKDNVAQYVIVLLYNFALTIVYTVVITICQITIIGILLIPILSIAMGVTYFNLFGQFARTAPHFEEFKSMR